MDLSFGVNTLHFQTKMHCSKVELKAMSNHYSAHFMVGIETYSGYERR